MAQAHSGLLDVAARGAILFASEGPRDRAEIREEYAQATVEQLEQVAAANERGIVLYQKEKGLTSGQVIFDPIALGMMERFNVAIELLAERQAKGPRPPSD